MTEKVNENLPEDDGMLEDEEMLKGVAGGNPNVACIDYFDSTGLNGVIPGDHMRASGNDTSGMAPLGMIP